MTEYIEREAVCYQLAKQATIDGQPRAIKRAAKIVANFPAADVRPVVRGEWIFDGHHMRCNQCKEYMCQEDREGDTISQNFCPNCGADMRQEPPKEEI